MFLIEDLVSVQLKGDRVMQKFVAIDMSKAYLLARMAFESKKVINDEWLNGKRRAEAATLYVEIGLDFNRFFINFQEITRVELNMIAPDEVLKYTASIESTWYKACVHALETFRNNLDSVWAFSYGSKLNISWLTE